MTVIVMIIIGATAFFTSGYKTGEHVEKKQCDSHTQQVSPADSAAVDVK